MMARGCPCCGAPYSTGCVRDQCSRGCKDDCCKRCLKCRKHCTCKEGFIDLWEEFKQPRPVRK